MSEYTPENDQLEEVPEEESGASMLDAASYVPGEMKFVKRYVEQLRKVSIIPGIAVITVGDDKMAKDHMKKIAEACDEVGIHFKHVGLASDVPARLVMTEITKLNNDPTMHAIAIVGSLPYGYNVVMQVMNTIDPHKDINCVTDKRVGEMMNLADVVGIPAVAHAIIFMASRPPVDLDGYHVVIVTGEQISGFNVIGSIMRDMLEDGAAATVCSIDNPNIAYYTSSADVLISLVGAPKCITGDMVKSGAIVIDAGDYHDEDGVLVGDVDVESVQSVAGYMLDMPLCDSGFIMCRLMLRLCGMAREYGLKPYSQQLTPLDLEQIDDGLAEEEEPTEEEEQPGNTDLC